MERVRPHHSFARLLVVPQAGRSHRYEIVVAAHRRVFIHGRWDSVAAACVAGGSHLLPDVPSGRIAATGGGKYGAAGRSAVAGVPAMPGGSGPAISAGGAGG